MTTSTIQKRAVISVHTKPLIKKRLDTLARTYGRTRSSLVSDAIDSYIEHQDWMVAEIQKGIDSANRGEFVSDAEMEAWFTSIGIIK